MKKILIIISILLFLGAIGFFLWPYFRPSAVTTVQPLPPPSTPGPVSTTPAARITQEIAEPILSYWFTDAGDLIYFSENGKVFRRTPQGISEEIAALDQEFQSAAPSPDGAFAVAAFGPYAAPTLSLLNAKDKIWQPLPAGATSAAWDQTKNRLIYTKENGAITGIYNFDLKTKKSTEMMRFPAQGLRAIWTGTDRVYLSELPSAAALSSLLSVNLKTRALALIANEVPGLMSIWAPNGETGLLFANSFKENLLTLIDKKGTTISSAPFVTLPSKCLFEPETVFCAVPRVLPSGIVLPDDWLKRKFYSDDRIVLWNTNTNEVKIIADNTPFAIDAEKLLRRGNILYFINRYDRKLYSIKI